jgi:hypothetical protein
MQIAELLIGGRGAAATLVATIFAWQAVRAARETVKLEKEARVEENRDRLRPPSAASIPPTKPSASSWMSFSHGRNTEIPVAVLHTSAHILGSTLNNSWSEGHEVVEVAGIEPASPDDRLGLLRA